MKSELKKIQEYFLEELKKIDSLPALEKIRVEFLGKKGKLTTVLKGMGKLSAAERPTMGKLANEVRESIESHLFVQKQKLEKLEIDRQLTKETLDVSLPGIKKEQGSLHPLTKTINELEDVFLGMGFSIAEGPEIEWSTYNFDYLNI